MIKLDDMQFKDLKWKALDYQGKIMIILLTDATNKTLNTVMDGLEVWHKDLFKRRIEKEGFHLEYVELNTY